MEPMTLGSPVQSPKNNPLNMSSNTPFLPAFLMGEQQTSPTQRHGSLSPTKSRGGLFKNSETPDRVLYPSAHHQTSGYFQSDPTSPAMTKQKVNEKSGPPVQGLFDTLEARYKYNPNETSAANTPKNTTAFDTFQNNSIHIVEDKLTSTPKRPFNRLSVQHENSTLQSNWTPTSRQPIDPLSPDNTWVTILGFPCSTTNVILAHFAQCGTIVEKKFPSQGNWVHIKYSNPYEASKALAFNGKVLAGSIMVGVLPHRLNELGNKENVSINESNLNNITFASSPRPVRSLAQPYLSPQQRNSNISETITSPVPQKSTGIVTKAMEYVFGW